MNDIYIIFFNISFYGVLIGIAWHLSRRHSIIDAQPKQLNVTPGTHTAVIRVRSGVMTGKTTWALSMLEGMELRGFGICYCPQTLEQARYARLHRKYKGMSFPASLIKSAAFPAFVTCAVVDDALVVGVDPQGQPIYEEATQVLINSILRKMQLHTCPTQLFIIERN